MLKKRYDSNGAICKVIFTLPSQLDARTVALIGDFNGWDKDVLPMKQAKDGTWKAEVELEAGREYQYRYCVDGSKWINDQNADKYAVHPYGGENSVVVT